MNKEDFLNFIKDLGFEYNFLHKSFTMYTDEFGGADLNGYVYRECVKISTFDDFANIELSEINKTFTFGQILFKVNYNHFNEESKIEFINYISKYFKDENKFKSFLRDYKLNNIL